MLSVNLNHYHCSIVIFVILKLSLFNHKNFNYQCNLISMQFDISIQKEGK